MMASIWGPKGDEAIRICTRHDEYPVPLIWTFAFPGAEWWCPYCGVRGGMFGTGRDVARTPRLVTRKEAYQVKAAPWLRAMGALSAAAMEIDGKEYRIEDLPDEAAAEFERIRSAGWEYQIKIEAEVEVEA